MRIREGSQYKNVSVQIKIYKYLLSSTGTYRGHGGHSRRETNVGHGAACVSSPAQVGLEGAVTVCLVTNKKKEGSSSDALTKLQHGCPTDTAKVIYLVLLEKRHRHAGFHLLGFG